MNINRMPSMAPEAANDNWAESPQFQMLQRTLSPDAWSLFEALSKAPTREAFEVGIKALNDLKGAQLNRADAKVGAEIADEKLAARLIEGEVNFAPHRRLKFTRAMSGLYTFTAL